MTHNPVIPDVAQRWRLRSPGSGREVVTAAKPGVRYIDRHSGEEMEVTGRLLPLAPSPSLLPWAVENLRFCRWCDQLVQKDLDHCPYDGRPLPPLVGTAPGGRRGPGDRNRGDDTSVAGRSRAGERAGRPESADAAVLGSAST